MALSVLSLIAGLVILYFAAEALVKGASRISIGLGISPLIVGLTVVGFCTSAPEFVVSLLAAIRGTSDIALGNVVGSNTANIGLILGIAALIFPMAVSREILTRDWPFMIVATIATVAFAWTGNHIGRLEGVFLFATVIGFLVVCTRMALVQNREFRATGALQSVDPIYRAHGRNALIALAGLVGLVIGAQLMVDGAVTIARAFQISELVIGVTVIAVGTSLPELATSVVAALRKEQDLSVGNIVGSNIFNLGFILGGVAILKPMNVPSAALDLDIPVMLGISLLLLPFLITGNRVSRVEGAALLSIWLGYVGYLVVQVTSATA